jgi:hypothetical protein
MADHKVWGIDRDLWEATHDPGTPVRHFTFQLCQALWRGFLFLDARSVRNRTVAV